MEGDTGWSRGDVRQKRDWEIEWREKLPRFRMWTNEEDVHLPDLIITEIISFFFFSFSLFFLFFRRVSRCSLQMHTKVLTTGAIQSWGWACSKVERPKVPRLAALSTVSIEPWDLGLSRKASSMVGWTCIWVMYQLYSEEYLCNIPGIID